MPLFKKFGPKEEGRKTHFALCEKLKQIWFFDHLHRCANLRIFLPHKFYVKSIYGISEAPKFNIFYALKLGFVDYAIFEGWNFTGTNLDLKNFVKLQTFWHSWFSLKNFYQDGNFVKWAVFIHIAIFRKIDAKYFRQNTQCGKVL